MSLMDLLADRIRGIVARAIISLVRDTQGLQVVQLEVLADEVLDDVERVQPYGLSTVPLTGAEAVVAFVGGDRSHPVAVVVDDRRHRPTDNQPGDVVLYHHDGAQIRLTAGPTVTVDNSDIRLGGDSVSDRPALVSELTDLKTRIATLPDSALTGAALKAIFAAWPTLGATKVKTD